MPVIRNDAWVSVLPNGLVEVWEPIVGPLSAKRMKREIRAELCKALGRKRLPAGTHIVRFGQCPPEVQAALTEDNERRDHEPQPDRN